MTAPPTYPAPAPSAVGWVPQGDQAVWLPRGFEPVPGTTSTRPVGVGQGDAPPPWIFPVYGHQGDVQLHWGSHPGGSDIFAARGTPVLAARGGRVLDAGFNNLGGNYVLIQGDDGLQYYYAHLADRPNVRTGQTVPAGAHLGGVGDTGNARGTGPHLHFGAGQTIASGTGAAGGAGTNFDAVAALRAAARDTSPIPVTEVRDTAQHGNASPAVPIDTSSRAAFVRTAAPYAQQIERETGIPAAIMVAIAVNEGAAARGTIASRYNNVMGIKATPGWTGAVTPTIPAWEVINGRNTTVPSTFRAYDSPLDSFRDFVQFLRTNSRYAEALKQTDNPEAFIRALQAANYATDPRWADKILSIAREVPATPAAGPLPGGADRGATPDYGPAYEWGRGPMRVIYNGREIPPSGGQRSTNRTSGGSIFDLPRDLSFNPFDYPIGGESVPTSSPAATTRFQSIVPEPYTGPQHWAAAGNRYEQQFGEPLDWEKYTTDDETYGYLESAMGMARAGELGDLNWWQDVAPFGNAPYQYESRSMDVKDYPEPAAEQPLDYDPWQDEEEEENPFGFGQDVGVGQGWDEWGLTSSPQAADQGVMEPWEPDVTDPLTYLRNWGANQPPEGGGQVLGNIAGQVMDLPQNLVRGGRQAVEHIPGVQEWDRANRGPGDLTPLDYGEFGANQMFGVIGAPGRARTGLQRLDELVQARARIPLAQAQQFIREAHPENPGPHLWGLANIMREYGEPDASAQMVQYFVRTREEPNDFARALRELADLPDEMRYYWDATPFTPQQLERVVGAIGNQQDRTYLRGLLNADLEAAAQNLGGTPTDPDWQDYVARATIRGQDVAYSLADLQRQRELSGRLVEAWGGPERAPAQLANLRGQRAMLQEPLAALGSRGEPHSQEVLANWGIDPDDAGAVHELRSGDDHLRRQIEDLERALGVGGGQDNPFRVGAGGDVGVGADWWNPFDWDFETPVLGGLGRLGSGILQATVGAELPRPVSYDPWEEERRRQEQQNAIGFRNPFEWAGQKFEDAFQGENPAYDVPVLGGFARLGSLGANVFMDVANAPWTAVEYAGGALGGLGQLATGETQTTRYNYGPFGGEQELFPARDIEDVFDPGQAIARSRAALSPVGQMVGSLAVGNAGFGRLGRWAVEGAQATREANIAETLAQTGRTAQRFDVPFKAGIKEEIGDILQSRGPTAATIGIPAAIALAEEINVLTDEDLQDPEEFQRRLAAGLLPAAGGLGAAVLMHKLVAPVLGVEARAARNGSLAPPPGFTRSAIRQQSVDLAQQAKLESAGVATFDAELAPGMFPYLQRAQAVARKYFTDRLAFVEDWQDQVANVVHTNLGRELRPDEDAMDIGRRIAGASAHFDRWMKTTLNPILKEAGIASAPDLERYNTDFKFAVMAFERSMPPSVPRDPAWVYAAIKDPSVVYNRVGLVPPGGKATGHIQSLTDALSNLRQSWQELDQIYGDGTGWKWYNAMVKENQASLTLLQRLEDAGVLAKGATATAAAQRTVYGTLTLVDQAVDDLLEKSYIPGRSLMIDTQGIDHAYSTLKPTELSSERTLGHYARLFALAEQNKVGLALKKWRDLDPNGFGKIMVENTHDVTRTITLPNGTTVQQTTKEFTEHLQGSQNWGLYTLYNNGEKEIYRLPKDLRDSLLFLNEYQTDLVSRVAGKFSDPFRLGVTVMSLPFIFGNMPRDFQAAVQHSEHPWTFVRNYLPAWWEIMTDGLDQWMTRHANHPLVKGLPGELFRGFDHFILGPTGRTITKFYEEGGGAATQSELIRQSGSAAAALGLRATDSRALDVLSHVVKAPVDLLETMSLAAELSARIGIYRAETQVGNLAGRAGVARAITTDFSKGGDFLKVASLWFPLLNARVQGTLRSGQAAIEDPEGYAWRMMLTASMPTVLSYAWNRTMFSDLYDGVSQEEKDRNHILIYGSMHDPADPKGFPRPIYLKIPKTEQSALFSSPLERMMDTIWHVKHGETPLAEDQRTERTEADMWLMRFASMLPIGINNPHDLFSPQGIIMAGALMNPITGTMLQLAGNHDEFRDRPIIDEKLSVLPWEYRAEPDTPWLTRVFAQLAKKIPLPEGYTFEPAPAATAFAISHLGGTAATQFLYAPDTLFDILRTAGLPVPDPYKPTTLADLQIAPGAEPKAYDIYLDTLQQADLRPWTSKFLSRFFGVGPGPEAITARAKRSMSPREVERWEQTVGLNRDYQAEKRRMFQEWNRLVAEGDQGQYSHEALTDKWMALTKGLAAARQALIDNKYPRAITEIAEQREFEKSLPGLPAGIDYVHLLTELPAGFPIETLAAEYKNPPGVDVTQLNPHAAAQARSQVLSRWGGEYGIPPATLRDAVAAATLQRELPALGVPNIWLDKAMERYLEPPGTDSKTTPPFQMKIRRQEELAKLANEAGVSTVDMLERINLRFANPDDQHPISLSRARARNLQTMLDDPTVYPAFVSREGQPMGTAVDWEMWNLEISRWRQVDPSRRRWPPEIRAQELAQANGDVARLTALYAHKDYADYDRWFGAGRLLSPKAWAQYTSGEVAKYRDNPDAKTAIDRDAVVRLWGELPPGHPMKRQLERQASMIKRLVTPGWRQQLMLDDLGYKIEGWDEL